MPDPADMRAKAQKWRELAQTIDDEKVRKSLLELASEFERAAREGH